MGRTLPADRPITPASWGRWARTIGVRAGRGVRRTYYDHEDAYKRIAAADGRGWDDLDPANAAGSYDGLEAFLRSPMCPASGPGVTALDAGCGGGQGCLRLARRGFATTGIDYAPTAITLARRNAQREGVGVHFVVADCLDLSGIEADRFDLVIDNHLLHCLLGDDRDRFLREVHRLLRPGGVVFSESMTTLGDPDFAALGVDPAERIDAHRTRYWARPEELVAEFEAAGLMVRQALTRPQPETPRPGDLLAVVATKPEHQA